MSMGYGANYADTVTEKFVEKIVGQELLHAFHKAFREEGASIQYLCSEEGEYPETNELYQKVCAEFEKKTGLSIELHEHDSDQQGSSYDEVNGPFWMVEGVWQKTPAGKKYDKEITRCFYVTFG